MQMPGGDPRRDAPNPPPPQVPLAEHSRFYQRLHRRYGNEFALLPTGVPVLATMEHAYDALRARGHDTGAALRVLRQLVMERLMRLDCEALAPLADITRAVTALAELALDRACIQARQEHPATLCRLPARHRLGNQAHRAAYWMGQDQCAQVGEVQRAEPEGDGRAEEAGSYGAAQA